LFSANIVVIIYTSLQIKIRARTSSAGVAEIISEERKENGKASGTV